jgi:hypothetical protein
MLQRFRLRWSEDREPGSWFCFDFVIKSKPKTVEKQLSLLAHLDTCERQIVAAYEGRRVD